MSEELNKEVAELAMRSYRVGMAQGSGSEYFLNGEIFNLDELLRLQREQAEKVTKLIKEVGAA